MSTNDTFFYSDDEDAEQVLLRGALTERGTAYRSRRRSSCPEGRV